MKSSQNTHNPSPGNSFSSGIELFKRAYKSVFVKQVFQTLSTRIVLIPLSLLLNVIVARVLGPEGRGLYALSLTIGAIGIQFCNFGLHSSNTYHVARTPSILPALFGNSIFVSFVFGGIFAGLGWYFFYLFPQYAPVTGLLQLLGLLWIPFGLAYLLLQNLLIGLQDVRSYNIIEISTKIFYAILIGCGFLLLERISAESILTAALLTLLFSFIWAFWKMKAHLGSPPVISISVFKQCLPFGIKSYIGSLLGYLLMRIDLLMINNFLSEKETGLYDIAVNMSEFIYLLPSIAGMILFPKLSSIINIQEKWRLTKEVGIWLIIMMVIICSLGALLASPIIKILYGDLFIDCIPAFIYLILAKFVLSINLVLSTFIASIHVPLMSIPFGILLVILNIYLNIILISKIGIIGAAIASIICYFLLTIFHFYFAMKYSRNGYPVQA
jgi:O-antigen/teichoic acid export membrane protein